MVGSGSGSGSWVRVHLGAGEAERAEVPQHQVVLRALGRELVALADEELGERLGRVMVEG